MHKASRMRTVLWLHVEQHLAIRGAKNVGPWSFVRMTKQASRESTFRRNQFVKAREPDRFAVELPRL